MCFISVMAVIVTFKWMFQTNFGKLFSFVRWKRKEGTELVITGGIVETLTILFFS